MDFIRMAGRARSVAYAMALLCCVTIAGTAAAQTDYPNKPIRLIVGFTAGSATDITARIFAQKFSQEWGVPVTVENAPGAGGSVGIDRGAKSEPDGYTLIWAANGATTIAPSLQEKLPYDPLRDLTPISQLLTMPNVLAVNPDNPAKTLQDFIALAKTKPGVLSYSTPGIGTPQHVGGELLKMLAGIDVIHVPYRGAVLTDVLGGRVTVSFQNAGVMLPIIREGKLRGLAISSLKRSSSMPELPTVAESGFPGFEAVSWFGVMGPAGMPKAMVDKIHDTAVKAMRDPAVAEKLTQLGLEMIGNSPAEFAAVIKSDIEKWAKVIKTAGIKPGS